MGLTNPSSTPCICIATQRAHNSTCTHQYTPPKRGRNLLQKHTGLVHRNEYLSHPPHTQPCIPPSNSYCADNKASDLVHLYSERHTNAVLITTVSLSKEASQTLAVIHAWRVCVDASCTLVIADPIPVSDIGPISSKIQISIYIRLYLESPVHSAPVLLRGTNS